MYIIGVLKIIFSHGRMPPAAIITGSRHKRAAVLPHAATRP
jgi:hypothetical protein